MTMMMTMRVVVGGPRFLSPLPLPSSLVAVAASLHLPLHRLLPLYLAWRVFRIALVPPALAPRDGRKGPDAWLLRLILSVLVSVCVFVGPCCCFLVGWWWWGGPGLCGGCRLGACVCGWVVVLGWRAWVWFWLLLLLLLLFFSLLLRHATEGKWCCVCYSALVAAWWWRHRVLELVLCLLKRWMGGRGG